MVGASSFQLQDMVTPSWDCLSLPPRFTQACKERKREREREREKDRERERGAGPGRERKKKRKTCHASCAARTCLPPRRCGPASTQEGGREENPSRPQEEKGGRRRRKKREEGKRNPKQRPRSPKNGKTKELPESDK